jgi:hypothetical protein
MAGISAQSHTVCLDCAEGSFTITGNYTNGGGLGAITSTLYVTDPSGNLVSYNADDLWNSGTSGGTQTIEAGTTSISGSNSVSSATLTWTTAPGTTYSFILRSMVSGVVQDYALSYSTGATTTATEIGIAIRDLINNLPASLNLAASTYSSGSLIDINGNSNVFFGVDALVNLTASSVTANTNLSSSFEDGIYIVKWVLTDEDNANPTPSLTNSIFLCNVEKCVREKASKVDVGCGCCGSRESEEAMDAILYLEGIKSAAACGKIEKAKTILSGLEDICNNDCKHC